MEGFFSGSEMALVSADRIKLRHAAAKGSRGAALALKMLEKPEWLLSTTLVGTNIAVVTNTTIVTAVMIELLGDLGGIAAIAVAAPLIWIFGEIVPKSVFQQRADSITPRIVYPLRVASFVFAPLLAVFTFFSGLITRIVGAPQKNPFTLREEIIDMLQMPVLEGEIQADEITMIRRMFNFTETTAEQVMVPIDDVVTIPHDALCSEALSRSLRHAHIRLPVCEADNRIIGVLNTLELLGKSPNEAIERFVRPVRYSRGQTSLKELLRHLRKNGDVVAVIVDATGAPSGIVTIEDIMEEVVEEMNDEYDSRMDSVELFRKVGDSEFLVSATVELELIETQLGVRLPRGNYTTVAGLMLQHVGEVPPTGTEIVVDGVALTVARSTAQAIHQVRIAWPSQEPAAKEQPDST
jgi:CBS domain containing-hemolysin-like protein